MKCGISDSRPTESESVSSVSPSGFYVHSSVRCIDLGTSYPKTRLFRWLRGKESPSQCRRCRRHGFGPCVEEEMATHSSILARKIPGTEEPGGLQSMGSQSWTRLSTHEHAYERIPQDNMPSAHC